MGFLDELIRRRPLKVVGNIVTTFTKILHRSTISCENYILENIAFTICGTV